MIRLLRHDGGDGAVRFDDLAEKFKARFAIVSCFWYSHDHVWSVNCNVSPFSVGLGTCLDDFRGISCFVFFKVTRAVLETLPSHVHLVACCHSVPRRPMQASQMTAAKVMDII